MQTNIANETTFETILDRIEIIDIVNNIVSASDFRDWTTCRAQFAEIIELDYKSLTGDEPYTISADEQIEKWRINFDNLFKTTQHIVSNHAITLNGDTAASISQFMAHHLLVDDKNGSMWILGGFYNHDLVRTADGWRVSKMKMTSTWEQGTRPF